MNLHEFQAKQLLQRYGLAVPIGQVVQSAEAACYYILKRCFHVFICDLKMNTEYLE
jgi:succinyl-CoA synthetase beta subunit